VHEKYLNLARDAAQNGDRVLAESYFQHAEHYYRIISAFTEETGGDANRNRGNGVHHNANDEAQGNHFQEGEPQPELNLSTANAAPEQPSPAREQTQPTSNATSNASSDAAAKRLGARLPVAKRQRRKSRKPLPSRLRRPVKTMRPVRRAGPYRSADAALPATKRRPRARQ